MADIWYLKISTLQEPYELDLDRNGRAVYCFNVLAMKRPSATFEDELVKVLTTALVGTFNTDIFATRKAVLPTGDGPYLFVVETSGAAPFRLHNEPTTPSYPRPTARITAHAKTSVAAKAKAYQAYNALAAVRNQNITVP